MGRIKESLIDRAPTIGNLKRQGVIAIQARCKLPCRRIGRVELSALRLPDETLFQQIPKLRRLRCSQCDRNVAEVTPIFPRVDEAPKVGHRARAEWVVVIKERNGRELTSSPLWSAEEAKRFAARQIEEGHGLARIETPTAIVGADEISEWPAGR